MSGESFAAPRSAAETIYRAAVAAAHPAEAVLRAMQLDGEMLHVGGERIDLDEVRHVWILGAGKAARGMAAGAVELLGQRIAGGTIAVPDGLGRPLDRVDVWEARHPVPDVRGMAAASEALRIARSARDEDLVLCLLSGGASALWTAPVTGVTIADLQQVTSELLGSGASIQELNAVRRHLSRVGGGMLARAAAPARVLTLAISDVVGSTPHDIGSGPTAPDPTSYQDALEILARHGISAPSAVRRHLQAGTAAEGAVGRPAAAGETAAPVHVVASIREALAAAAEEAVRLGYEAAVMSDRLEGEARETGAEIARAALAALGGGGRPSALLWGGETTVSVRGRGRGGRNQEVALSAALALDGAENVVVASLATDGVDGPTSAAGAIVDPATLERGKAAGLDPHAALQDNDSYTFLRASGDLLVTGPTGTNVNDVVIALVG